MIRNPFQSPSFNTACACALAIALGACAGLGKPPEEVVSVRAQDRLDYLLAEDFEAAYEYFSPGYRSGFSLRDFQRRQLTLKVQWRNATVLESNCSSSTCNVRISVDYTVYGALPGVNRMEGTRVIEENWIDVDGKWYLWPKD